MATRERRRHLRIAYIGPILLAWEDASGGSRYAKAKCLDISMGGLRVEVSVGIPVHSCVRLNAEQIKLSGTARVKEAAGRGSKFILGLELNGKLREEFLTKRDDSALRAQGEARMIVTGVAD